MQQTILVIEDEVAIALLLADVLEEAGYQTVIAANGMEGLALLDEHRPDLVLCDLKMPVMDGRQVCMIMAQHPQHQAIPRILMTAGDGEPFELRGDEPYTAIIAKPFRLDEVVQTIQAVLRGNTPLLAPSQRP